MLLGIVIVLVLLLLSEKNPPIQQVIQAGIVPRLVELLQRHDNPVSDADQTIHCWLYANAMCRIRNEW